MCLSLPSASVPRVLPLEEQRKQDLESAWEPLALTPLE